MTNSPSPWRQRKTLKKQTRRVAIAGVTFAPLQEQTFDILDRSDFSREEIEACWWAPQELQMIRENKQNGSDDGDCIDGTMEEAGCQSSQQYVQYMLSQQSELRRLGIDDPSGLSIISRSVSKQSRKSAERRAIRHAEYMRETEFSGMS